MWYFSIQYHSIHIRKIIYKEKKTLIKIHVHKINLMRVASSEWKQKKCSHTTPHTYVNFKTFPFHVIGHQMPSLHQTNFFSHLGPSHSLLFTIQVKPLVSSALAFSTQVIATSTKICTKIGSTQDYSPTASTLDFTLAYNTVTYKCPACLL